MILHSALHIAKFQSSLVCVYRISVKYTVHNKIKPICFSGWKYINRTLCFYKIRHLKNFTPISIFYTGQHFWWRLIMDGEREFMYNIYVYNMPWFSKHFHLTPIPIKIFWNWACVPAQFTLCIASFVNLKC